MSEEKNTVGPGPGPEETGNPGRPEGESGKAILNRMNRSHAPLREWGFTFAEWKDGMRILDEGCGGGATIYEMLQKSRDSVIDGIDYMETSVQSTGELNKEYLGTRCRVQQADVTALPFPDDTFDLITAVETVYFWPELQKALQETFRVCKPGGRVLILNEAGDPDNYDWPKPEGVHFRVYRPEELEDYLKKAGFRKAEGHHGAGQYIAVYAVK